MKIIPVWQFMTVQQLKMEIMTKMKMILLLLILTSSAAAFELKVTQTEYEAKENGDVTMDWTFNNNDETKPEGIFIKCEHFNNQSASVLYHAHAGIEISETIDKGFSVRVQSESDLREGRIRLHVSRLRTEDSGLYVCHIKTGSGSGSSSCVLRVSAADDQTHTDRLRPEPGPGPGPGIGLSGLIIGLSVAGSVSFILIMCLVFLKQKKITVL